MSQDKRNVFATFFKDTEGHIVIGQRPNIPICAWGLLQIAELLLPNGHLKNVVAQLAMASLFTWAYLELATGVNYFRRSIGLVVLVFILLSLFRATRI